MKKSSGAPTPVGGKLPCQRSPQDWEPWHDRLRAEPRLWARHIAPIGIQAFPGQPSYELGNCRGCHSTLMRLPPAEGAVAHG